MSRFAEPMVRLIDSLKKLPGIGSKSAQRLAFYILRSSDEDAEALAAAVRDVKANLRLCSMCNNITDLDPCVYCSSATRNQSLVCVVEEPTNIAAIEKTKHFNGVYHVLHGSISPLHGIGPEQLRIANLITRVDAGSVDEVIIATNPTVEGEATATYRSQQLKRAGLKVTRIAMGIPVGSDIEYTDEITMLKPMEGRREVKAAVPVSFSRREDRFISPDIMHLMQQFALTQALFLATIECHDTDKTLSPQQLTNYS